MRRQTQVGLIAFVVVVLYSNFPDKAALIVVCTIFRSIGTIIPALLDIALEVFQDNLPGFIRDIEAIVRAPAQQALLKKA